MIPFIHHDSRVRSPREVVIICINWPRCIMLVGFSLINHPFWGSPIYGLSICGFSPFKSSVRLCRKSCKAFTKCATGGSCKRHGRILGFPMGLYRDWDTGWWCNNHLEKYESQWEGLSHIIPIYEMENRTCLKPPGYVWNNHVYLWKFIWDYNGYPIFVGLYKGIGNYKWWDNEIYGIIHKYMELLSINIWNFP